MSVIVTGAGAYMQCDSTIPGGCMNHSQVTSQQQVKSLAFARGWRTSPEDDRALCPDCVRLIETPKAESMSPLERELLRLVYRYSDVNGRIRQEVSNLVTAVRNQRTLMELGRAASSRKSADQVSTGGA